MIKSPQHLPLERFDRILAISLKHDLPVMPELLDAAARRLHRLLALDALGLDDLHPDCLRVAVLLKKNGDLILTLGPAEVAVVHAYLGHLAYFCRHRSVGRIVPPAHDTLRAPDAERQVCSLVSLPVGLARGARIARLAGLPGLLPGGLEVMLLRLALDLVGLSEPGNPVPGRCGGLLAIDRLQQPTVAAIATLRFTVRW